MTTTQATQSSSTLALAICLSIIVVPPILTAVLSVINSVAKRYGQSLLHLLNIICAITAYLAQLAMIVSALCCVHFSLDAISIHSDETLPRFVVPAYLALIALSLALGFMVLAVAGLYLVELTVWSCAMKMPTELAIVMVFKTIINATVEYIRENIPMLQAFVRGWKSSKVAEKPAVEDQYHDDGTAGSESTVPASELSESPLDIDCCSDIEQWK